MSWRKAIQQWNRVIGLPLLNSFFFEKVRAQEEDALVLRPCQIANGLALLILFQRPAIAHHLEHPTKCPAPHIISLSFKFHFRIFWPAKNFLRQCISICLLSCEVGHLASKASATYFAVQMFMLHASSAAARPVLSAFAAAAT